MGEVYLVANKSVEREGPQGNRLTLARIGDPSW